MKSEVRIDPSLVSPDIFHLSHTSHLSQAALVAPQQLHVARRQDAELVPGFRHRGEDLAQAGARVAIGDIDEAGAKAVAAAITDAGGQAEAVPLDVTDYDASAAAVDATRALAGRFDILVNNAGSYHEAGSIIDQSS